jgi:hypothetical protein
MGPTGSCFPEGGEGAAPPSSSPPAPAAADAQAAGEAVGEGQTEGAELPAEAAKEGEGREAEKDGMEGRGVSRRCVGRRRCRGRGLWASWAR